MPTVKVYSTPTCPYCIRAKSYLQQKGIPFENYDVSTDEEKLGEMVKVSGQMGVPVIVVDNEVIVGFDQGKLEQLL
ncbi:MAG: glutaredoxin family protein [Candidatus Omnitrophota bacterium]|nr:glutaredoxin family protein [Candidatus Omnitrophota bacterium]